MKKYSIFAMITVIVLSLFLLEQIISANRKIAHISYEEQTKAIEISSLQLGKNLEEGFTIFVKKVGEYYYNKDNEGIKTVRVSYIFNNHSVNVLVDIENNKVVQITDTTNFDWMKDNLLTKEEDDWQILKETLLIAVILLIIVFFWVIYRKS